MTRRDEPRIMEAISQNPNIRRVELATAPGEVRPMSDLSSIITAGTFAGVILAVFGWFIGHGNAELAAAGFAIGSIFGALLYGAFILTQRLQRDVFEFTPAARRPEPARFVETLNQGHRLQLASFPTGWTIDNMRRFARETWDGETYQIAYRRRPDWVTEDMLKAFRAWCVSMGYGKEGENTAPWTWTDEGVRFMDDLRGVE